MPGVNVLAGRIDVEFSAFVAKIKSAQAEQVQAFQERQQRMECLGQVFDQLKEAVQSEPSTPGDHL